MTAVVRCLSPVDGRIVAERPLMDEAHVAGALEAARRPTRLAAGAAARAARLRGAAVDAMLAMRDDIVPVRRMCRPAR